MTDAAPILPHSVEAEEALIGSVLIDPEVYPLLAAKIKASDFYIVRLGWIWGAFVALAQNGAAIDFLTVCTELERVSQLTEVGGPAYITALLNQVPSSLNAEHYAEIVANASDKRKLLTVCNSIATAVYAGKNTAHEILAEAEQLLHSTTRTHGGVISLAEALSEHYDETVAISSGKKQPRVIPTGFYDIDKMMAGGMRGGELVLLGGRPGQGKSTALLTIAAHNLKDKRTVLLFSPEMSSGQITGRVLAMHSDLDSQALRKHQLDTAQFETYTGLVEQLSEMPLFMDDLQSITPQQMRARCLELQNRQPVDLVIVDYIQLMISERAKENRVQEVSYLSRSLKMMARELNVPVLTASQLSRAVEARDEKRPRLSDLRESGSLEQDADVVMFVWNPDEYAKGNLVPCGLSLSKQRNGPTGDARIMFNKSKALLVNGVTA